MNPTYLKAIRLKDSNKWYAALLNVSKKKLGFSTDEPIEILDIRMKARRGVGASLSSDELKNRKLNIRDYWIILRQTNSP